MPLSFKEIKTPFGPLKIITNDSALKAILWPHEHDKIADLEMVMKNDHPILVEAERQLTLYFSGRLRFFNLPIAPVGTLFQLQVWSAVGNIPFGKTKSYAQIAEAIGRPTALRAVGGANKKNPLAILTPCHRVIGSNGSLTGFTGAVSTKKVLLSLESEVDARAQAFTEGL